MGSNKWSSKNINKKAPKNETDNLFRIVWNDIIWWGKNIFEILNYKPDAEKIVRLYPKEEKEEIKETAKNKKNKYIKYLDESIFRFQIWKMQENDWTIYSKDMLKIWIKYMINHTKKWEKSIIQIWSDVWNLLQQWNEEWVLNSENQKEKIEKFIKRNFRRKGNRIKVIVWSKQYPDVFEALNKGQAWKRRFWIIPKDEDVPDIGKYLKNTKKQDLSPLPMIQYLAYHASKDKELMKLFYDTKPPKYKNDKKIENYEPWSTDADYYWIVEVWLRLTEILKWISIQWWAWRQRVYDKIISLILYWEDVIPQNRECPYCLHFGDKKSDDDTKIEHKYIKSEALQDLHKIIKESWLNTDFKQLYVELDRKWLDNIWEKKEKKRNTLKNIGYWSLIFLILASWFAKACESYTREQEKKAEKEKYETMISDHEKKVEIENTYPYHDSLRIESEKKTDRQKLHEINYPDSNSIKENEYLFEQENILLAAYDISRFNYIHHGLFDNWLVKNKIIEEYKKISEDIHRTYGNYLPAEIFMERFIEILADMGKEYQKPYAHLEKYKQYIENTLKYWDKIEDILKYKVEEEKIIDEETEKEKDFYYYNEQDHELHKLKFVELHWGNNQTINLILASEFPYEKYTLEKWLLCMKSLVANYWENVGIPPTND